ncbi:MAG: 23S rRNA (adenine(2030)-N(6))-methyltransferase RlmJ [Gammaproteobacteria bacterium]|nr:23S rRNA (adenine(2030)-N(6))-methyltransferase RlmJ [Gammaproteobacteria bacterium]
MLSYRHAFHAGNHADVLKHVVLMQILAYMQQKEKPFLYVDTHAGAGLYDLRGDWACKTHEYESGIARLWCNTELPEILQNYLQAVQNLNAPGSLDIYPGSPWLAHEMLRPQDKARLFELHSNEFNILSDNFSSTKNIKCEQGDGFKALTAILPPESRRAVVLIDPPYEIKTDYQTVVQAVKAAYKRFATGIYMIWYPVINRRVIDQLEQELADSGMRNIVQFELSVTADATASGMTGSGMIVLNPPWQLEQSMKACLPWLQKQLALDETAAYRVSTIVEE